MTVEKSRRSGAEARSSRRPARRKPAYWASFRTLLFALAFPVLHFLTERLGIWDPAGRPLRESAVLSGLLLLGGFALLQYHLLARRAEQLWRDRTAFEQRLRDSEQDLRLLVERQQTEEEQRKADERFDKAFQAYPYGLSFHDYVDGTFLDVNPAFERIFEFDRDALIGKTPEELQIWENQDEAHVFQENLRLRHELHEFRIGCRAGDGRSITVLMSVAWMDLPHTQDGGGGRAWLVVARPA